ncbi:MAG: cbb3-type cytochrome c oxidase subunit I [Microthrixaceae bacterium]
MALTETRSHDAPSLAPAAEEPRAEPTVLEQTVGTADHRRIGRWYVILSLVFAALALVVAALANIHQGTGTLLDADLATRLIANNPFDLLLASAFPLMLGLAVYLVPLQVGAPSLSFPRAAAMSLWAWLGGVVLFTVAWLADGSYGGNNLKLARLGPLSIGLMATALCVGVLCVAVTVFANRTEGMTLGDVPFFSFSMVVTAILWLTTLPVLLASITVWQIRRPQTVDLKGDAFAAVQWFLHQPAMFIVAIPVLGLFADMCAGSARHRQHGYGVVQAGIAAFGLFSFGAWATTATAESTLVYSAFTVGLGLAALVVVGSSADTLRRGRFEVSGSVAMGLVSVVTLLLATAIGVVNAVSTLGKGDLFTNVRGSFVDATAGTVVGQLYLVIGATVVMGAAATFHWSRPLFGHVVPKGVGLALAPAALVGALLFGFGQVIVGYGTPDGDAYKVLLVVSAVGALLVGLVSMGAGIAAIFGALGGSHEQVDRVEGGTLEWIAAKPSRSANFDEPLALVAGPYPLLDLDESATKGESR